MSVVRFGVLGCGNISKSHCDAIVAATGAELVGVCDEVSAKLAGRAAEYGVPGFVDFDELLQEVDAISVCLPSGMHSDYTVRAAQAGKHVLTEKPLDITLVNGLRMVEAAESAGVKLGCISQHRFARDIRRLHDAAQSGELGTLLQGDSITKWYRSQGYYDSAGWRGTWKMDGGGALMNQSVHYIDMIQWIMGGVKAVQARIRTGMHNIEVEDSAMAMVEYHSGAVGFIQGSTSFYPGLAERLEVHGTKGTVVIEGDRAKVWVTKETAEHEPFGPAVVLGKDHQLDEDPTAPFHVQHGLQIQDFTNAILEDRAPFVTGRAALEPLKVILAIYESSRRGGERVELAELTR